MGHDDDFQTRTQGETTRSTCTSFSAVISSHSEGSKERVGSSQVHCTHEILVFEFLQCMLASKGVHISVVQLTPTVGQAHSTVSFPNSYCNL